MEEEKTIKFSCTSKMSKNEIAVFESYIFKKLSFTCVTSIILICLMLGGAICFIDVFLGIAGVGIGVIVGIPLVLYLLKNELKKKDQQTIGDNVYLNRFDFYEDVIEIESQRKNGAQFEFSAKARDPYSGFAKAIVYSTYIFLLKNGNQAFILDQKGMTTGTAGELIEFLKSKGLKIEYKAEGKKI